MSFLSTDSFSFTQYIRSQAEDEAELPIRPSSILLNFSVKKKRRRVRLKNGIFTGNNSFEDMK